MVAYVIDGPGEEMIFQPFEVLYDADEEECVSAEVGISSQFRKQWWICDNLD